MSEQEMTQDERRAMMDATAASAADSFGELIQGDGSARDLIEWYQTHKAAGTKRLARLLRGFDLSDEAE